MESFTRQQLIEAFRAGMDLGHNQTVAGEFAWCEQGQAECFDDWFSDWEQDQPESEGE